MWIWGDTTVFSWPQQVQRTQLFHLIFTEPGKGILVHPCSPSVSLPFLVRSRSRSSVLLDDIPLHWSCCSPYYRLLDGILSPNFFKYSASDIILINVLQWRGLRASQEDLLDTFVNRASLLHEFRVCIHPYPTAAVLPFPWHSNYSPGPWMQNLSNF